MVKHTIGTVLEIDKKSAIVMTQEGRFETIKRSPEMFVGQQVIVAQGRKINPHILRYSSMAAGIAAIFILSLFYFKTLFVPKTYAFIDVDINPSIELAIDEEYQVIKAENLNKDAENILRRVKLKGLSVQEALNLIVGESKSLGYMSFTEENFILVSASLNSEGNKETAYLEDEEITLEHRIKSLIEMDKEALTQGKVSYKLVLVSQKDRNEARQNNISMGKYYVYLKAKENGEKVDIDEIREKSVKDALDMIGDVINHDESAENGANSADSDNKSSNESGKTITKGKNKTINPKSASGNQDENIQVDSNPEIKYGNDITVDTESGVTGNDTKIIVGDFNEGSNETEEVIIHDQIDETTNSSTPISTTTNNTTSNDTTTSNASTNNDTTNNTAGGNTEVGVEPPKVDTQSETPSKTDEVGWARGVEYSVGDIVEYQGKKYKCLQAHKSLEGWEPSKVPALWKEQKPPADSRYWNEDTYYEVGIIIIYNGNSYRCIQAHMSQKGWEPPQVPALWEKQ